VPDLCDELARWSPPADRLAAWQVREPILAGYDLPTLAANLLAPQTGHEERDAILSALVRLARDDDAAATAVVVCLLPGVRRHAHRFSRTPADRDDVCAEMVAQTLAHVRAYDLRRRPARIAANLLLDAMSHTLDAVRAETAWRAATCPLDDAELPAVPPPDDPDPLDVAVSFGVLRVNDAALIGATRCNGLDLATVAALHGLSYEAAKKRRQRAEAILLAWLSSDRRSA
jgi:DNA-directed RNA polymerase specialized sigma24 family protein